MPAPLQREQDPQTSPSPQHWALSTGLCPVICGSSWRLRASPYSGLGWMRFALGACLLKAPGWGSWVLELSGRCWVLLFDPGLL